MYIDVNEETDEEKYPVYCTKQMHSIKFYTLQMYLRYKFALFREHKMAGLKSIANDKV
jgi:hypothetical protein